MKARVLLPLVATLLAICSCRVFEPSDVSTISGRLSQGIECTMLRDGGTTYELAHWNEPIPPMGSLVTLRVKAREGVSFCMVGPMVEVLRVIRVVTDFRIEPVTGSETWTPNDPPIVLGQVEVVPGASLTILPGTAVRIIDHGALSVRGMLRMVGTATDSIRITGGEVMLDSAQAGTQVSFVSLDGLYVRRGAQDLDHITARAITAADAQVRIRRSNTRGVTAFSSSLSAESCDLGYVDGFYSDFAFSGSTLSFLQLSYSRASVQASRFIGERAYMLFHGQSGGTLERNTFSAAKTEIEIRHTSDPEFHENSFLSPSTRVATETYQLQSCVRMERNWWGTAVESEIAARIAPGSDVCYSPWLTGPPPGIVLP